jgi:hypothetical protein
MLSSEGARRQRRLLLGCASRSAMMLLPRTPLHLLLLPLPLLQFL